MTPHPLILHNEPSEEAALALALVAFGRRCPDDWA